jgi:23S rRNA pseudouridine1911/1915/1917 synthase
LYEDNHLLVVVKPPGVLSQADHTGAPDMVNLVKADLKARYHKPGNVFAGLVHRLDRNVGGVMVFAKTSKAAARLAEQMRAGTFAKAYLAVVHGVPRAHAGTLRHYLAKNEQTNTVAVYPAPHAGAKEAVLDYEVVTTGQDTASESLVAVRLHTGRPHQIRAQLAYIGHPLVGDQKYGVMQGRTAQAGGKPHHAASAIALWSGALGIAHPTTKEPLTFISLPLQSLGAWQAFTDNDYAHAEQLLRALIRT